MALEQKLSPRLQQRLVMTPALQMAIKLLQLNKLELERTLQQEMVENPVLEDRAEESSEADREADREATGTDDSRETAPEAAEAEPAADDNADTVADDLDADSFFEKYFDYQPTTPNMREQGEAPPIENTLTTEDTLSDHLLWQLEMTELTPTQAEICEAIVGNLDNVGYLRASVEEIAAMGDWTDYLVERCVGLVQDLDPPGVAARDLRECLLLQLRRLDLEDTLSAQIVRDHFELLTSHRYKDLARGTKADLDDIAEAIELVKALNPKPGHAYSSSNTQYVVPDVFVQKDGDSFRITVDDDGLPKLRVSRLYREMLKADNGLSDEAAEYLRDKLRSALWLIKSFGQRQRTIRKVAESIVTHQKDFLERGVTALRPMVLRDVAEDIEMHESTVSRVVNGKYMHTPQGIFEMKFFFHSGLGHASGSDVSSVSVKQRIRNLIDDEDATKPLSDAAVAKQLKEEGLQIARRTVAKYREELGIPASKARRAIR